GSGRLRMSEPRALVEHFFRHEFGRLGAVLTRSLGVRRLDLVEDVVQAALVQALETWSRRGVPEDPAGWLYRTARNLAIDALRRERTHAQALPRLAEDAKRESSPLEAHFAEEIGDESLRLLFVCCHEAWPAESPVAPHRGGGSADSLPRQPGGRGPEPQDGRWLPPGPPGLSPLVSRIPGDRPPLGEARGERPDQLPTAPGVRRTTAPRHGQPPSPGAAPLLPLGSGWQDPQGR